MKWLKDIESVGWVFWAVVFALLLAPGIWLAYKLTYDTASVLLRLGCGIFLAAIASGLISWLVEEVIHRRNVRRYNARRKVERKEKKRKKKK